MFKFISFKLLLLLLTAAAAVYAFNVQTKTDITQLLNPFIPAAPGKKTASESPDYSSYESGDWNKYIIEKQYRDFNDKQYLYEDDTVNILSYGSMSLDFNYGKSFFTNNKYKKFDEDKPVSRIIPAGFSPEQLLLLHVEGNVGRRLTIFIDHDSRKKDNHYLMQYRAINDDEVLRELNAGEIDIKFNNSKYAVYDNTSSKGLGVDAVIKKNNLQIKGFGSISRGITEVEIFNGTSSPGNIKLSEFQFIRNRFYQIEPYIRYDSAALINYSHQVFTSLNPNTSLSSVNINPSGFELYFDDQNPQNNNDAVNLSIDGGYYSKLRAGTDYLINFSTGLITFIRGIAEKDRIFAVYNLISGSSTDPAVNTSLYPGKNFVFIKYGPSIAEDTNYDFVYQPAEDKNGDGRLNLDIYEVRSCYYLGDRQVKSEGLRISFFNNNSLLSKDQSAKTGKYSVDFTNGIVNFNLREPFKQLVAADDRKFIYTEIQPKNVYDYSKYSLRADYHRDARTFQLKHFNIIPGSVRIKVNGITLLESLYTIDYVTGFLIFTSANNPVIVSETKIEIKYEYLPFEGQTNEFTGGLRTDYKINKDINVGGSVLYSGASSGLMVPNIGSEPEQTVMLEGDVSMRVGPDRLASISNFFSQRKVKTVPAELYLTAELAKSYKGINAFGKALIDNMESPDEIISLSLSEKDWILSSIPSGGPITRSIMNYFFFRDISDTALLKGIGFNAKKINYSIKPGPYNIAFGHIADFIQKQSNQRSLVIDFDSAGDYASITTRKFSSAPVDMSGLQYVEVSYYYEGTGNINLFLDLGKINEDSDADGILDTEDINRNGFLDTTTDSNTTEDRGYLFNETGHPLTYIGKGASLNSYTSGDGVLNTEDLNGNGSLDTVESIFRIPSFSTNPSTSEIISGGGWKKIRIHLNQSAEKSVLKQVESIRLFITKTNGTSGKIYIDDIKFVNSKWKEPKINAGVPADPSNLKLTMVNTVNDSDYRNNAFIFSAKSTYNALYGEKKDDELSRETESALQLEYSGASSYSITRRFTKPIDIRHYKLIHFWMNFRSFTAGDSINIRLKSSDSDYVEYSSGIDTAEIWKELILKLGNSARAGIIATSATSGTVDMRRINSIEFIITSSGTSGKIWLNDIYVSDPDTLEDTAHWYEAKFKINKPLYVTKTGVPVLSDMNISYIKKGHGAQFSTIGKIDREIALDSHEISSSMKILPGWDTTISWFIEKTKSDPLDEDIVESSRGDTESNTFFIESGYASSTPEIPSIKVSYKYNSYDNNSRNTLSGYKISSNKYRYNHSPLLVINKTFENIFSGKLIADYYIDAVYKEEIINRSSDELDNYLLSQLISVSDKEKKQKNRTGLNLAYNNKNFFIRQNVFMDSEEVVYHTGSQITDNGISGDVLGSYHFPFLYGDNMRFIDRNNGYEFKTGLQRTYLVAPEYKINYNHNENSFKDRLSGTSIDQYPRTRDSRTGTNMNLAMPVNLERFKTLKPVKLFLINYSKSMFLNQTSIPYEGENIDTFDESYGLKHSLKTLGNYTYDFFNYYPGYFFTGRKNYAMGRDTVYNTLNQNLLLPDGNVFSEYNNQMKLIENFSLNTSIEFKPVNINAGGGLFQSVDRQNIYGTPVQIVTKNGNISISNDLMKILSISFFRPNKAGLSHHSSFLDIGYSYTENQLITSNIEEIIHSPSAGLNFKWDRSLLSFKAKFDLRYKYDKLYINYDPASRDSKDDIYIANMPQFFSFKENDNGYTYSVLYETDMLWIYNYFSKYYKLTALPIFSIEYLMTLNRYNYQVSISPEPYDLYLLSSKLTLDLHKNIQGGISTRIALEQFHNRNDNRINNEILSYEIGFNFSLIF